MSLKVLIIGYGSIARRHGKNLKSLGVSNISVCDTNPDRLVSAQEDLNAKTFQNLDEALISKPDIAFICTPPNSHVAIAIAAAKQGCHLFIEKPLSNQYAQIDELLEILQSNHLITMVGCNMRFHPGLMAVKRLLDEKAIGKVVTARVEFGQYLPDWHPNEDYRNLYVAKKKLGGGVILDVIHEIDYIRWLMGEVRSVVCFADKLSHLEMETEDTATMLFRFDGGAFGEVHVDCVQRTYNRSCDVIGDEGIIHWSYVKGEVSWYSSRTNSWAVIPNPPSWEPNQMYVDELRHFFDCVKKKEKTIQDLTGAARVLEIALKAKESAELGKIISV